ncbi:MAG: 3-deoxy-7-phosphoheptulonate synthase [Ruthenibacterium sp.]
MIISTKRGTPAEELDKIIREFEAKGLSVTMIRGTDYNVFGLVGDTTIIDEKQVLANPYVENVQRVSEPYKKANRLFHEADSIINVGGIKVGGHEKIVVIGGPCSVEGKQETIEIAHRVKAAGGCMLRGGAYKPRTSPYAFQGLGSEGILDLVAAREVTGMPIVSELMSEERIDEFEQYVDLVQIGARNMQNFQLLKAVGKMKKPILLKRGLANTIEEWIMSAEYIMASGNENVIFCERGIRTFEKYTRNTLDLSVIPIIKEKTHLPIIIDPSHATGNYRYVESMSLAAVAAGADGLMIEVHVCPEKAWSDGAQSLKPDRFANTIDKCRSIAQVIGREILSF